MAYTNHKSLHKQICRDFIFNEVNRRFPKLKELNMCSLPNINYELEERIISNYHTNLYLIERDKEVMHVISTYWAGVSNVNVYYGDLFNVIGGINVHFDVIWADLCCQLTINLIRKLSMTLGNINKPCVFAITLLSCREPVEITKVFGTKNYSKIRYELFPKLIGKLGFKLVKMLTYNSESDKRSLMTTYLFTN